METAPKVIYTTKAQKDLRKLERRDSSRIVARVRDNALLPNPLGRAKMLRGNHPRVFRYRIGNYRAIFEVDDISRITVLSVLRVGHRKEVYLSMI